MSINIKRKREILVQALSSQIGKAIFSLEDEQVLRDQIKDEVAYFCGERLRLARLNSFNRKTRKCYTHAEVGHVLGKARQTIGDWENAKTFPDTYQCHFLCELYGCDMGYLMGEYDTFRYVYQGVQAETGLSTEAVAYLTLLNKVSCLFSAGRKPCETLSKLLENKELQTAVSEINDFDLIVREAQRSEIQFCSGYSFYTEETLKNPAQEARLMAKTSGNLLSNAAQNYLDALNAVDLAEYRIHKALESCLQSLIKKEV